MKRFPFYSFSGVVTKGKGFGRTIGFPTANIPLDSFALRYGVYLCRADFETWDAPKDGIVNIGVDPTFGSSNTLGAEVFLFDFSGDLYGLELQIDLLYFMRPEETFPTVAALKEQIRKDQKRARDLLENGELCVIARIENGFHSKFGLPRQSGMLESCFSRIVFEKDYRVPEALREIGQYSHLWLLWQFSGFADATWSPTIRPPKLGGNRRIGVFASRSPHRPNPIGLSCVRLVSVEETSDRGAVLVVDGADLKNGTPIYDIKPYLAFCDAHAAATGGYADEADAGLRVEFSTADADRLSPEERRVISRALSLDPRPAYQNDPGRIYVMQYSGFLIRFRCENDTIFITGIQKADA